MLVRDLVELSPGSGPPVVCFPPAGAAPVWFRPLVGALPVGTPLYGVQLPGHGSRLLEPPLSAMSDVVAAAITAVERFGFSRCVLFGHDLGAIIAFEVARYLRQRAADSPVEPVLLVVSGCQPPRHRDRLPVRHTLGDAALVTAMIALGAPAETYAYPEVRGQALPVLRADLRLAETWRPAPTGAIDVPILVLAGADDPDAPPADAAGWQAETTAGCAVVACGGGHFFVPTHATEVGGALVAAARELRYG